MTDNSSNDHVRRERLSAAQRSQLDLRVRRALEAAAAPASRPVIPALEWRGDRPLSFAQEGLYFMHRLTGGDPAFNRPFALRLRGQLDTAALEWSLAQVAEKQTVLRSVFSMVDGIPVSRIEPLDSDGAGDLLLEDYSQLPGEERELESRARVEAEAQGRFDLEHGPLRRFGLIRLDDEDHILWGVIHHIAFDAWSATIFEQELAAYYSGRIGRGTAQMSPPAIQYSDYAAWQRQKLTGPVLDATLVFWAEQLSNLPEDPLGLLATGGRSSSRTGERFRFTLPIEQVERLRVFAAAEGATPFMALLAVYAALLRNEFGATDLPIGVPVAERRPAELERLIGLVVNMLVFRCDVSGNLSYRELLQRIVHTAQSALDHQEMPFDLLVHRLRPQRRPGLSPLFQAVFNYRAIPRRPITPGLPPAEPFDFDPCAAQFALDLEFTPHARELDGTIVYKPQFFDRLQISEFADAYQRLLACALDHPDWAIVEQPLGLMVGSSVFDTATYGLPEFEKAANIDPQVAWNRTRREYPRGKCIVEIFREIVAERPEAEALIYSDAQLTYAQLDQRSDHLAETLRALGVRDEAPVGLHMERSAAMVVAMLAVLKAGGAYLPLDPAYPPERLAYMVADSGVSVIVTRGDWEAPIGVQVVDVDNLPASLPTPSPAVKLGAAESLAYIMYTSGSTGRPKGIEIPQRGVIRLVKGSDYLQVQPGERVAQGSNMSFDAATLEVWNALLNGGVLVGLVPETLMNPARLAEALLERKVDHLFLTTALFNQVAMTHPEAFAGLKTVMFGGEAANPEAARRVLAAGCPERLLNLYGPTETTVVGTWYEVQDVPQGARSLPIGMPIANTTAYVLDDALQPVLPGEEGELYLGGDGLARGYLRRPGLTSERFIPNPFGDGFADCRLYRTGDRVHRLEDGSLEYVGRVDNQVKLRGFRIEPGEIEAALSEHPKVTAAAVGVQEHGDGIRLVAYVVWNGEGKRSGAIEANPNTAISFASKPNPEATAALRSHLRLRLPEFMIPSAWAFVGALPVDPNGKLDRLALEQVEVDESPAGIKRPPQSALEKVLAGLWAEALGVSELDLDANFFESGGHSLLAIKVISRVQDLLRFEAPLSLFYEANTLEAFGHSLQRLVASADLDMDLEQTAQLILNLTALSDADVEALLAQEDGGVDSSGA